MLKWWRNTPTLKLVIHILFLVHVLLSVLTFYDNWTTINNDWYSWHPFIILLYTLLWGLCVWDSKKAYYAYLFLCFFQVISIVYCLRTNVDAAILKTFFPLNLFFAFVLLFDIKRLMSHARTR
jgi:hypothetical protein